MPFRPPLPAVVITAAALATALIAPAASALPSPDRPAAAATAARASLSDAQRVDRVLTPKLAWYRCFGYAECATARLPLDYDDPRGATTELALLRVKARNPKARLGSLFVNPGGPGSQSTAMALAAPYYLGDEVLDRFDIVGVDPRGIGFSENLKCFRSVSQQSAASAGLRVAFPNTRAEESAYITSARAVGRACASTGSRMAGAMSTAEVARDMDVLRRAVGDRKLSFLGFSYGSVLGQYYANMFPDRIRAVAVDGVLNPTEWVGTSGGGTVQEDRLRSGDGAYRALREILVRCDRAGTRKCVFAAGDPVRNFDVVMQRLRAKPLVLRDPELGSLTIGYADVVTTALGMLYDPAGYEGIAQMASDLLTLTASSAKAGTGRATAGRRTATRLRQNGGYDFPYENSVEAFLGVTCADGRHPTDAARWPSMAAAADRSTPYFGRAWAWPTAPCARNSWTARDEDAYTGPFNRRTVAPVLVVGAYWDPATNYRGAVQSARLLPNSRLLSSDSWGHTAYGTSACVTGAIDTYLVKGLLPHAGTVCRGDVQPFAAAPGQIMAAPRTARSELTMADLAARGLPAPGTPKQLPPVAAPILAGRP